jgi:aspartate racemase
LKTLGIIGGIGPESTIDYYRLLLAAYREQRPDGSSPSIFINSIDVNKVLRLAAAADLTPLTEYLVAGVEALARAGAACGLLAANTPHLVFDQVLRQSPIPLISIVEATCEAAKAMRLKKLALFGATFTMQGRFYPDVFSREGIELIVPRQQEQAYIHDKYLNEVVPGTFLPETRAGFLQIATRMKEQEGIDGVILGGTELPLLLRGAQADGIVFLDTTRIHVHAAIQQLMLP